MSRSRRRPYWSMADSVKCWKKTWHKTMRAKVRMQLKDNPENIPVVVNENAYSDVYDSPRDGSAQYAAPYVGENGIWSDESAWKLTRK